MVFWFSECLLESNFGRGFPGVGAGLRNHLGPAPTQALLDCLTSKGIPFLICEGLDVQLSEVAQNSWKKQTSPKRQTMLSDTSSLKIQKKELEPHNRAESNKD